MTTEEQEDEKLQKKLRKRKMPAALDEQLKEVRGEAEIEKEKVEEEQNPQGAEEGTAQFDPSGVASFVHGQMQATIRNYEDRKKHWTKLKLWAIAARKIGFYKLADFLDSYVRSEGDALEKYTSRIEPIRALILEAKKFDDMTHLEEGGSEA